MSKLNIEDISDKEAFMYLANRMSKLSLEMREKYIVVMKGDGRTLIYKVGDILSHAEKVLKGERDEIGELELKYAKEEIAYERSINRKT